MTRAVRQAIALDIALARIHSKLSERPWGMLFHNTANPDHYDSNSARQINAADPELTIAELTEFYQQLRLTPRARLTDLTVPADFGRRLEAHGYVCDPSTLRVMVWEGAAPPEPQLPRNVTIERAGPADLETAAQLYAEGFGSASSDWIAGFLRRELDHPDVRCYLARIDGVAASTLTVLDTDEVGLVFNVATVPGYRGHGLATMLVAHAQAWSTRPLLLEVMEDNAERIYVRAGFQVRGELHQISCWLPDEEDL